MGRKQKLPAGWRAVHRIRNGHAGSRQNTLSLSPFDTSANEPALTVRILCLTFCPMSTLTVTAKGQVTLRKDLLEHLGVGPGEQIDVTKLPDGRIEVRAASTGDISSLFGMLTKKGRPPLSIDEMNEITKQGWSGKVDRKK
jgi:AbrB family looped-hinge helix DNA binding protein